MVFQCGGVGGKSGAGRAQLARSTGRVDFSSGRRHTRCWRDWSSDVCSSDLFREQRLLCLARVADDAGALPAEDLKRIGRLAERLDGHLEEPERPSLIHGDVWSANVLAKGDRITAFLDPAIYHADPEIELTFISLFHSFGRSEEHTSELQSRQYL